MLLKHFTLPQYVYLINMLNIYDSYFEKMVVSQIYLPEFRLNKAFENEAHSCL